MKILNTNFSGLKIVKGKNYYDNRGYFREIFKNKIFKNKNFIFWCVSKSKKNIIRGLHLQRKVKQDLFVSVIKGKIFDVVVDLRKNSKKFGIVGKRTISFAASVFLSLGGFSLNGLNMMVRKFSGSSIQVWKRTVLRKPWRNGEAEVCTSWTSSSTVLAD